MKECYRRAPMQDDDERGRELLQDLARRVREKVSIDGEPILQRRGVEKIEIIARMLDGEESLPGLRVLRNSAERLRLQRDGRRADVVVEWMRDAGALALGGERNGRTARSILYTWDELAQQWRMMGGESELYEDLVIVLIEYLYPEVRERG